MARFVALYALNDRAKTAAYVSGPGRREQLTDKITASSAAGIPTKPDGVDPDDGSFRISLMLTAFESHNMPGPPPPCWGFPFHAACWEILSHACAQADLSWVQTLFHLCRSLPDQRGIRGLAVILNNGQLTQWIGNHDDIPKRRLVFESGASSCAAVIDIIQGGFDAFKLVTLSVSADLSGPLPDPDSRLDFKDRAIWYPNIPNPDLTMLGTSGKIYGRSLYDEAVARFLVFGSTDGDHARNPTQVTVRMKDNGPGQFTDFREIIISFDPAAHQTPVRLGLRSEKAPQEESLVMDGPGGERITALDSVYEFGQLLGFTIRTSFGRAADFPAGFRDDISPRASVAKSVHCPAKERIVGFWATTETGRIFDLGLISAQSVASDEGNDEDCGEELAVVEDSTVLHETQG
ncbi:hypothetical protein VDGE_03085 [Verticillium dahliae]|uniref:DUF7600 domain-containing protein n=1 Tax=Verticillium dahliae TaxID=27337 RepID=A0A444RQJ8_VERDA|nr:hypothetical protein VDGE_03085 [Verticillium dahliae]